MNIIITPQRFIEIAVNNEFAHKYTRNLVKTYLYKALLINPKTNKPYNNHQIGCMIGTDRQKVSDYLFHIKVFNGNRNNPFLTGSFETKFESLKKACEGYINEIRVDKYREAIRLAQNYANAARIMNKLNWN